MYYYKHQNADASVIAVTNTATNIFDLINTAGSTTAAFAGYPQLVNGIDITPEDGDIRILFDNTPTASKGQLLSSGTTYMFRNIPLAKMKLIRTGGSNVACSVAIGTCKDDECSSGVCYESSSTITGTVTVQGDVANDTADAGNPVKIGGKAASAQPTAVTAGDRVNQAYDLYGGIVPAGFNWTNISTSTTEFSPLDTHYTVTEIANATSVAANTYYYPDSSGVLMTRDQNISCQYNIDAGGGGTATLTVEATIDGSEWVDVTKAGYNLSDNTTGNTSFASTGTAVAGIVDFDKIHALGVRYKVVVATQPADAIKLTVKRNSL